MSWLSEQWDKITHWADETWEGIKDAFNEWVDLFTWSLDKFMWWFQDIFLTGVGLAIGITAAGLWGAMVTIVGNLYAIGTWVIAGLGSFGKWAAALAGWWDDFMDWLHWDEINQLSDLGELVSPEYREVVQKVYGEISKVSAQLGLGSGYMLLALANVRNVVLSSSSLMGHSYDLAETEWMFMLGGYLEEFNEKAETYKKNPAKLLVDIQQYFEPDIIKQKVGFQKGLVNSVGAVVKGVQGLGIQLKQVKQDIEKTILELPEKISKPIYDAIKDEFEVFDTFMKHEFEPALRKTAQVTDVLTKLTGNHDVQINSISGLLSNPGEILANINALPEIERLRQEDMITEISTRAYSTEAAGRNNTIDEANKELVLLSDALEKDRKPPSFLKLEYEGKPRPASIADGAFASWQVGDY